MYYNNPGIQFVTVRCPNCNAQMTLENYRTQAFCSFCGSRFLIHNDNERVIRTVNEADIRRAEAEYAIGMQRAQIEAEKERQKMEFEKQKQKDMNKAFVKFFVFLIVMMLIGIGFIVLMLNIS